LSLTAKFHEVKVAPYLQALTRQEKLAANLGLIIKLPLPSAEPATVVFPSTTTAAPNPLAVIAETLKTYKESGVKGCTAI